MPLLLALLALAGCSPARPTCDVETRSVEDDEADLGDLDTTAAEAIELVSGELALDGAWEAGDPASVSLSIERGDGTAALEDATPGTEGNPLAGRLGVEVPCDDRLIVPVHVSVSTDDGRVEASGEGELNVVYDDDYEIYIWADSLGDGSSPSEAEESIGSLWAGFAGGDLARVEVSLGEDSFDAPLD